MSNKDKIYMNIAKACLGAINKAEGQTTEQTSKAVFEAIDAAFSEQFGVLGSDYKKAREALETISKLSGTDLEKAPSIAQQALTKPH